MSKAIAIDSVPDGPTTELAFQGLLVKPDENLMKDIDKYNQELSAAMCELLYAFTENNSEKHPSN